MKTNDNLIEIQISINVMDTLLEVQNLYAMENEISMSDDNLYKKVGIIASDINGREIKLYINRANF